MKNRPAAPFIVSAMALLATSLGVADATAQAGRNLDRQDDSTVTAGKGDRLTPRAAESRQIKISAPTLPQSRQIKIDGVDDPRPQSRQIKIEGVDDPRPQSRQIKIDGIGDARTRSRQIKTGPAGDGG